ncbi:MAG: DUF1343 domain-containing protein [bacterium]
MVSLGLQEFLKKPEFYKNSKLGLLVHPASVDAHLNHSLDRIMEHADINVISVFGPQHGIYGETQDNMVEWEGFRDKQSGKPVFSLYGRHRKPTRAMLKDIDLLIIDLQDIGARYYTFIWTMALCMEACAVFGKKVIILDRPNPINGISLEGGLLNQEFASFVGLYPLLMRHGMTIGEIALYLNGEFNLNCELEIVPMQGWRRNYRFEKTGLHWVIPSPNMPTLDTAAVYPGMCLLEGTNLSEGRGTTRPFEIFGAPFVNGRVLAKKLKSYGLPGVFFRPITFIPTFQKWAGVCCGGIQIHVLNRDEFRPVATACRILQAVKEEYKDKFCWKKPPYEYENKKMPIDILSGSKFLRETLDKKKDIGEVLVLWEKEAGIFSDTRGKYLLYK